MKCPRFRRSRSEIGGGSVESRETILGIIRAAGVPASPFERVPIVRVATSLDVFCERVEDYRAEVHRVSEADLESVVKCLCSGKKSLIAEGFPFGIPEAIEDPGFSHMELAEFDTTITTCAVGIEESGTIVLDGGAGQGRRAITLIPDHHICLIRADQVVATLEEAIARLDGTRPLTFISGPSATSDIELVRVEGVHGPRKLEVVVVDCD